MLDVYLMLVISLDFFLQLHLQVLWFCWSETGHMQHVAGPVYQGHHFLTTDPHSVHRNGNNIQKFVDKKKLKNISISITAL